MSLSRFLQSDARAVAEVGIAVAAAYVGPFAVDLLALPPAPTAEGCGKCWTCKGAPILNAHPGAIPKPCGVPLGAWLNWLWRRGI